MPAQPPSTQVEHLAERVPAELRRVWVPPRFAENPPPLPPDKVEEVSRAVLDVMLTRPYRVGPLPEPRVYEALLHRVRYSVQRNQPIFVSVGYGPLKNQNAVSYSRADWAEFFALCHLVHWHNKVQPLYAPGLFFRIYFDDATLSMANKVDKGLMKSYIQSVTELTKALGFERLFMKPLCHSSFAWAFWFGPYALAGWLVRRWERKPENQPQIEKMLEYARRNIAPPAGMSAEEQERFFKKASHRYRVYWETLQLIGVTNSWKRVVAMYLDGTQHHLPQLVALHLTTVAKGQVTQPWQGEGVLLDNGHGKLEPFVLTAGRRQRHSTVSVPVSGLVNMPGFDRISVAWANTQENPASTSAAPAEARQPAGA